MWPVYICVGNLTNSEIFNLLPVFIGILRLNLFSVPSIDIYAEYNKKIVQELVYIYQIF
jgi:hypothetical protein